MKTIIKPSTFNVPRSGPSPAGHAFGCPVLNVEGWMFLFSLASAFSLSAQTSSNALPPLAPAYPEIPPTFLQQQALAIQQHKSAVIISLSAVFVVAFLFLRAWRRKKSPAVVPRETAARQALEKWRGQPEDGKALSGISRVLRRYLSAAIGFPSGEMTTAEICAGLSRAEKIGTELSLSISDFLHACDQRKFSPPRPAASMDAVDRALDFVSRVEVATCRQGACATTP